MNSMKLMVADRGVQQRVGAHTALAMLQIVLIVVGYGSGLSLQFGGRLATTSYSGLSLLLMLLLWATPVLFLIAPHLVVQDLYRQPRTPSIKRST